MKPNLSDPSLLSESLTAVQTEAERESTPIRDRIMVIDNLLADHQRQLKRLLDLYLAGEFEREVLTDRKNRLESTLAALERERANLAATLEKQLVSDARIQSILAFANNQKEKVELATRDFTTRRALIAELDVRASLVREGGEVVIYASCVLGEKRLCAEATIKSGTRSDSIASYTLTARLTLADFLLACRGVPVGAQ